MQMQMKGFLSIEKHKKNLSLFLSKLLQFWEEGYILIKHIAQDVVL